MTMRLVRMTVAMLLLAGTAACAFGGGPGASPCDPPADDEPTTFSVTSSNLAAPNVINGCIDTASDTDIFDLTVGTVGGTGTYNIRCFGATGVAEFDTPATSAFVACTPGGTTLFNHNEVTTSDIIVQAQTGSPLGAYRLEIVVA